MRKVVAERDWSALVGALEAGAAAGVAWWLAVTILGVDRPLYAPVAAVVVVGAGYSRRIGRVGAMLGGMAIAIAVSEIGVRVVGSGPVQMALLTAVAILVARRVTSEQMTVVYAGLNAAILVAIGGEGWVPDRVLEGAIGAASAYALVYLVLPPRPEAWVLRAIGSQVQTAQENLARAAQALREASPEHARRSEQLSERIDRNVDYLDETVDFSKEVSRFSPWRRQRRSRTEALVRRARDLQSILRDTTVVVRMASRHAMVHDFPDRHLAAALEAHGEALGAMLEMVADGGDPDLVNEPNDATRRHAQADCDNETPLHFALVEELLSLGDRVAAWPDEDADAAASGTPCGSEPVYDQTPQRPRDTSHGTEAFHRSLDDDRAGGARRMRGHRRDGRAGTAGHRTAGHQGDHTSR